MSIQLIKLINSETRKLLLESEKLSNFIYSLDSTSLVQNTIKSFVKERIDFITSDLLDLSDILFQTEDLDDNSSIIDFLNQNSLADENPNE